MSSRISYFISLLKVLIWPIVFTIGQFIITLVFTLFFNAQELSRLAGIHPLLSHTEIQQMLTDSFTTLEYQQRLNQFLNNQSLWIVLVSFVIFVPIFYFIYKKYKSKKVISISPKEGILMIVLAVGFAILFNIIVFLINQWIPVTNIFDKATIPIWVTICCSGIMGPILEELLFRGIIYNQVKSFNPPMRALIFSSIVFALAHNNWIQMIYGFIFSFLLLFVYEKYHTLKAPILFHIAANCSVILFLPVLQANIWWVIYLVMFICIVILLFFQKKIKKEVYSFQKGVS